jgi:alpha-beta hydrolase superfamily lysophospholipase
VFAKTERIAITDAVRADAFKGESFAKLSDGYTHYVWNGPEAGPVLVFVHGFSSPCFIWEKQAEFFAAQGYRVLRYDLFGRGHSDRPNVDYDADLYHRQLVELLDSQQVTGPVGRSRCASWTASLPACASMGWWPRRDLALPCRPQCT